jgi:Na+/melibiose symporter-like transporter
MPSWALISARIGKHRAYMLSMLAYACIVPLIAFVIEPTSHWLIVVYAAGGVAVAGTQIFPYAMIADIADESHRRTGLHHEGTFAGVLVAVEKIGVAGGTALCGVLLASFGFAPAQAGHTVQQSPEALSGILVCFGAVPAILMIVAALAMLRYPAGSETSADQRGT